MKTISVHERALAIMISIEGKHPGTQLEMIMLALRGATEQAAQIAERHGDDDEFTTITKLIAKDIRATK